MIFLHNGNNLVNFHQIWSRDLLIFYFQSNFGQSCLKISTTKKLLWLSFWEISIAFDQPISVVCACMIEYQHVFISVNAMIVIYSWINLVEKLSIYSGIQKPNMCRNSSASGFSATLKPNKFIDTYFKRWQTKTTLWLTAMNLFWAAWVAGVPSAGTVAPEQEKAFREATVVFLGAVLSVIEGKLVDVYSVEAHANL